MSVNEKMTAIADAIRACTGKTDKLGLDGMIEDLAAYVNFDLSTVDMTPMDGESTLDAKLRVLADIVRISMPVKVSSPLSLSVMRNYIRYQIVPARTRIGTHCYLTFKEALAAAKDGDTITLLKDVSLDGTVVIEKSIAIDGNGYKITTTFHNYLFNIRTTAQGAFLKLMNVDVTHSHMVANVWDPYYSDITIENATFTDLQHFVYFRSGSEGSLTVKNVTAENIVKPAISTEGINAVSIVDSTITSSSRAMFIEHSGPTLIKNSTIKSAQKDYAISYLPPDNVSVLTIKDSTVENNSTGDGLGVALYAPYGRGSLTLSGNTHLLGRVSIEIQPAISPTFADDYNGYGFLIKKSKNYYLCETLDAAIGEAALYDATIYAVTEEAKEAAENAGYSVVLDSATGYYIVT